MYKLITDGIELKNNKKPFIKLNRNRLITIGNMKVKNISLSISELNTPPKNYSSEEIERNFLMVLIQHGVDIKEFKRAQIPLTEEELIQVRDSINKILNYKNT